MSSSQTSAARMRSTARRSSPISSYAVGSPPYVTAEQFELRSTSVSTQSVKPGATLTATASYGSDLGSFITRFDIDTDHPDYCDVDRLGFSPGADLYLRVRFGNTNTSDGACWLATNNDSATESVEVAAPVSGGNYDVVFELVGRTTGRVYDADRIEVQVDEQAPTNPDPDPPDDGDNGDNGGGNNDGNQLFGPGVAIGGVAVIALVAALALS